MKPHIRNLAHGLALAGVAALAESHLRAGICPNNSQLTETEAELVRSMIEPYIELFPGHEGEIGDDRELRGVTIGLRIIDSSSA